MTIADRIKKIREIFGITSNEFAKITGIHPVSIRKYETNKMVPGNDVIEKMSEALRLPKYIFEGLPKQYTDYSFEGDFYQQLLLLLDNGTLNLEGPFKDSDSEDKSPYGTWFSVNPLLSKYIKIRRNGEEIPIEDIQITLDPLYSNPNNRAAFLLMSFQYLEKAREALSKKYWRSKSETREDYSNRLTELAHKTQFELMLLGHSWKQYMNAPKTREEFDAAYQKVFEAGGDYYDLMDQLDIPEAEKNNYIHHYEDAWIELHAIDVGEYPHDGSEDEKWAYAQKIIDAIKKYKEDHPNYPKEIREACAVETRQLYEEYLKEQKKSKKKKVEPQKSAPQN